MVKKKITCSEAGKKGAAKLLLERGPEYFAELGRKSGLARASKTKKLEA